MLPSFSAVDPGLPHTTTVTTTPLLVVVVVVVVVVILAASGSGSGIMTGGDGSVFVFPSEANSDAPESPPSPSLLPTSETFASARAGDRLGALLEPPFLPLDALRAHPPPVESRSVDEEGDCMTERMAPTGPMRSPSDAGTDVGRDRSA